jgi:hypothetical protein
VVHLAGLFSYNILIICGIIRKIPVCVTSAQQVSSDQNGGRLKKITHCGKEDQERADREDGVVGEDPVEIEGDVAE